MNVPTESDILGRKYWGEKVGEFDLGSGVDLVIQGPLANTGKGPSPDSFIPGDKFGTEGLICDPKLNKSVWSLPKFCCLGQATLTYSI